MFRTWTPAELTLVLIALPPDDTICQPALETSVPDATPPSKMVWEPPDAMVVEVADPPEDTS
jgi:hypothetical protein